MRQGIYHVIDHMIVIGKRDMAECSRCNGTGWANAARDSGMEGMPVMLQPLGVYRCTSCGGTGDTNPLAHLSDEQRAGLFLGSFESVPPEVSKAGTASAGLQD